MSEARTVGRWEHAMLAGDAFVLAAAIDILLSVLLEFGMLLVLGSEAAVSAALGPVLGSVLSIAASAVSVFGGALLAWWLHGRRLDWPVAGAMVGGTIVGTALALPALVAGWSVLRWAGSFVEATRFQTGPWFEIGVLVVLVGVLFGFMVFDAVRDAARDRGHLRLDWVRLGATAVVVLLAGVLLPWIGAVQQSEIGEAGIFMVPFGAAGAFAAIGADLLDAWRRRRAARVEESVRA